MYSKKLAIIFSLFSLILCIDLGVVSAKAIEWNAGYIEAEGYGLPPTEIHSAVQAKVLAKRAALTDARRNLLELVSGIHLNSQTTVEGLAINNDIVKTKVAGFVQGAVIKSEQEMYDGTYRIILRVPLYGIQGLQTTIPEITADLQQINPEISKIILEKTGDCVEINNDDVSINLNWYQERKNSIRSTEKVDLDLGCFWQSKSGDIEILDPLNKNFGNYDRSPYVQLDNDDRSGHALTGENLKINGKKIDNMKRILVYSYIYSGVAKWSAIDGVITIKQPNKQDIIIKLDSNATDDGTCAAVIIENTENGKLKITRSVQYFASPESMDKTFNCGFSWSTATKD